MLKLCEWIVKKMKKAVMCKNVDDLLFTFKSRLVPFTTETENFAISRKTVNK